jgi:hypothetical protein
MGSGIAQVAAMKGIHVVLLDRTPQRLGHYCFVSMTLNGFGVPVPDGS